MTVANHSLGGELAAVVLHNLDLFFLRMGQEFPLGLFHIVLGSKFGVLGRLLPEKSTAAKVCLQGYKMVAKNPQLACGFSQSASHI